MTRTLARQEAGGRHARERPRLAGRGGKCVPVQDQSGQITDAELTYVDEAKPERPLRVRRRTPLCVQHPQRRSPRDKDYPSEFWLEGTLFESGTIRLNGRADFLAEPHVAVKADLAMDGVPLGSLIPVTARYNVQLSRGVISAEGSFEYAPSVKVVNLKHLTIDGLHMDYVHAAHTKRAEAERAKATVNTAQSINANEDTLVRVEQIRIDGGELGFVNQAANAGVPGLPHGCRRHAGALQQPVARGAGVDGYPRQVHGDG